MKICVFQSSFAELQGSLNPSSSTDDNNDQFCMNPGRYITQHAISHRTLHKQTAKAQIDEAIAEGFDFYLDFLWGTYDDDLAGVDAIRYFESFNLPSAGIQSLERAQSKHDFNTAARMRGSPLVPGSEGFPLFVKPASSYGSMFIDNHSLCRNEAEITSCVDRLARLLRPVRLKRAAAMGEADPTTYADACEVAGKDSTDLVVQRFIDGEEFSVVVIAMGETPTPLIPQRAKYKAPAGPGCKDQSRGERFLTLDLKFDADSGYELLREDDDPALYRYLQEVAVEAFKAKSMHTNNMGCDVDMRLGSDGQAYVIEVDPLPVFFYPPGHQLEDTDVQHSFPAAIYNHLAPQNTTDDDAAAQVIAGIANGFSPNATVLDIACGDGIVGRVLQQQRRRRRRNCQVEGEEAYHLIGVDMSSKMLERCRQGGWYSERTQEPMEVYLARRIESVDHIFCVAGLQFLSVEELDFVLARCFQLANCSVNLLVDRSLGPGCDAVHRGFVQRFWIDHEDNIRSFGEPTGWKVTEKSLPHMIVFRFEGVGYSNIGT